MPEPPSLDPSIRALQYSSHVKAARSTIHSRQPQCHCSDNVQPPKKQPGKHALSYLDKTVTTSISL